MDNINVNALLNRYLEHTGEHRNLHRLCPSRLRDAIHVSTELIEKMVNDLRREDTHLIVLKVMVMVVMISKG